MTATIRTLAESLGLSPATVSNALSGNGRIAEFTRRRVKQAAAAAGYCHNPLAASVMAKHRRAGGGTFQGVLAVVQVEERLSKPYGPFHLELVRSARERAHELGFKLEPFVVGRSGMTMHRLDLILQSRAIYGIVVLPSWSPPDYSALDWTRYAGAYTDYGLEQPGLNCICCDHYASMIQTLQRLADRGYRRPGLFLEQARDARLNHRWSAAFLAFQHHQTRIARIPLLSVPELKQEAFTSWFERYEPDVVISHFTTPLDWMENCGARIPDVGYVCLNLLYQDRPAAGLDLQPQEIGARATETVIAQLQRNERGLPKWPTVTTTPARWVDGPTVRDATKAT